MKPFPDEHELIGFFESEPALVDTEVPWLYNCLKFTYSNETEKIICEIEPSSRSMIITWNRSGNQIARFEMLNTKGLKIEGTKTPILKAIFDEKSDQMDFELCLKPFVSVKWGNESNT
jgi:hypothetical protein